MRDESAVRLELSDYACDICSNIEYMTSIWKDSGLSWNTDILSKFYVMSLLAKDIEDYLYKVNDKDNKAENEKEAHERKIDGIIEALIQGVKACDGIADVKLYEKAHDDATPEDINEALVIVDQSKDYAVYRPTVSTVCEDHVVSEVQHTLVTRSDITFDDCVNYILRKMGKK